MVSTKKPNRKIAILVIRPPKGRGDRNLPAALDKGVGNAPIVRPRPFSIQTQMAKKKPYQMGREALNKGLASARVYEDQRLTPARRGVWASLNVIFIGKRECFKK
ncbi:MULTISPECIES: hypothetical protein [unclassified Pseudomonas]|uniref:hypothetical protein n=1 Tax=unclassified Pseudomonas TaxID=196821 RepID=UPI001F579992|nr:MULTISPECIES: hypothetical protein [unclassified Pseudomonas]